MVDGRTRTGKIVNRMKGQVPRAQAPAPNIPIALDMSLPNHSGDHSAGIVRKIPSQDFDIANKYYVDSQNFWQRVGTVLSPKTVDDYLMVKKTNAGTYMDFVRNDDSSVFKFENTNTDANPVLKMSANHTMGLFSGAGTLLLLGVDGTSVINVTSAGVTVKQDLDCQDNDITGGFLEIDQQADSEGIQVNGYDDKSGSNVKLGVSAGGNGFFQASGGFDIITQGGSVTLDPSANCNIYLPDNSGTFKFKIFDSGISEVASIDSDGNADFTSGDITTTGDLIIDGFGIFKAEDSNRIKFVDAQDDEWLSFGGSGSSGGFLQFNNSAGAVSGVIRGYNVGDQQMKLLLGNLDMDTDSYGIRFGASQDSSIYYDGTDLKITTDLVAASDLVLDCGTDKTIELQETVWDDINVGSAQLSRPSSSQPDLDTFTDENGTDTGIQTYAFAVGEKVHGSIELIHTYKEGTDLKPHVHFHINAAPTGTDKVKWQMTYTFMKSGETMDAVSTVVGECDVDTQYGDYFCELADITGTNLDIGDQLVFTLERIAASADEFGGDALIGTFGIHHEVDTMGSRQVSAK